MGKIFIHIGLPKTATTSLQAQYFSVLDQKKIKYLGVFQPRSGQETTGYRVIIDAINSGATENAKKWLKNNLNGSCSVLLSEECILVTDSKNEWRCKLENLGVLLDGLDYELLVTVRDPVSAIFSYYIELYKSFSRERKSFLDLAMFDPRMEIYHYSKLFSEIEKHFEARRVFVKKFEEIKRGDIEDLGLLLVGAAAKFGELKNHNSRCEEDGRIYTGKAFTVKDFIVGSLKSVGISNAVTPKWIKAVLHPLLNLFGFFKLHRISVPILTDEEEKTLNCYLEEDKGFLRKFYGIDYE